MEHRHLVLASALTWAFKLGYVAYLGWKWRRERRPDR
jgi:hypothetical protein